MDILQEVIDKTRTGLPGPPIPLSDAKRHLATIWASKAIVGAAVGDAYGELRSVTLLTLGADIGRLLWGQDHMWSFKRGEIGAPLLHFHTITLAAFPGTYRPPHPCGKPARGGTPRRIGPQATHAAARGYRRLRVRGQPHGALLRGARGGGGALRRGGGHAAVGVRDRKRGGARTVALHPLAAQPFAIWAEGGVRRSLERDAVHADRDGAAPPHVCCRESR